jgi:hypothetical protein
MDEAILQSICDHLNANGVTAHVVNCRSLNRSYRVIDASYRGGTGLLAATVAVKDGHAAVTTAKFPLASPDCLDQLVAYFKNGGR